MNHMSKRDINKLVKKYKGWFEGDTAYFPSPYLKDLFLKELKN